MTELKNNPESAAAKEIRSLIEFEITRLDDRIKALFTVQSLMFVALGFAWDKSEALTIPLSIAGAIAVFTLGGIAQTSVNAINTLEEMHAKANTNEINDGRTKPLSSMLHSRMRILGRHPIFWIGVSSGIIWGSLITLQVVQIFKNI